MMSAMFRRHVTLGSATLLALGLTAGGASFAQAPAIPAAPVAPLASPLAASPAAATVATIRLDGSVVPGGIAVREGAEPMVWFAAAQRSAVGEVDPASREVNYIPLGHGAKPRAVTLCPNGQVFALDPALNVIHEINPATEQVKRHPMPGQNADLLGAVCTAANVVLFTGYAGWLGKLDASSGEVTLVEAHGGRGPGAIAIGANGVVWYASYVSNQLVRVDPLSLRQDPVRMPQGVEGPKGVAVDAGGRIWVTAFRSQRVARYDPRRRGWDAWRLADGARPFAIVAEPSGAVMVTDTGRDLLLRFDPADGGARTVAQLSDRGQARALARLGDRLWITEFSADRVTVVEPGGAATQ